MKTFETYLDPDVNTCISCGAEIPEGLLVCPACENGWTAVRCVVCDRYLPDGESVCPNCKSMIFGPKKER